MSRLSGLALVAMLVPSVASASELNPLTGKLDLAADVNFDFEGGSAPFLRMIAPSGIELSEAEQNQRIISRDAQSIQGERVLQFGGGAALGYIRLDDQTRFVGRRVEITVWQRGITTAASVELAWFSGDWNGFLNSFDPQETHLMATVPFFETGRVTDDGWFELSSGPIDFALGGSLSRALLWIQDRQIDAAQNGFADYDVNAEVWIDAIEIVDSGPALVPRLDCRGAGSECGADGLCYYGRCVDASALMGPAMPQDRLNDYVARIFEEIDAFEGGRSPRSDARAARAALEVLVRDRRVPSWSKYAALQTSLLALQDGHLNGPIFPGAWPVSGGACFYLGEADLMPQGGLAPLLAETTGNVVTSQLSPGDVMLTVDGMSPADFRDQFPFWLTYYGDQRNRDVITTEEIFDLALRTGAAVVVGRCNNPNGACTTGELTMVTIDTLDLARGFWRDVPPEWRFDGANCDFRFTRTFDGPDARDSEFVRFQDESGIRVLQFNGVPGGRRWSRTMQNALRPAPERLLMDERRGGGGTIDAVDLIGSHLVRTDQLHSMELYPALDRPLEPLRPVFESCAANPVGDGSCGNSILWTLGITGSSTGSAAHTKVAALITFDVSGNDFLTQMLRYRDSARTRIFGPGPTFGAFGAIVRLPARTFEDLGGSIQIHDTIFFARPDDPNRVFLTGRGVEPDVVIYQKQSDAMRGVDTMMNAAKEWLNQ